MEKTHFAAAPRHEGRFILAAVLTAAVCVGLAFWFAVPLRPSGAESAPKTASLGQAAKVDLNTADIEALCTLPDVGESRARAIVDYRVNNGWFASVDDAVNVEGVTRAMVDSWAELVYVSRRPY